MQPAGVGMEAAFTFQDNPLPVETADLLSSGRVSPHCSEQAHAIISTTYDRASFKGKTA